MQSEEEKPSDHAYSDSSKVLHSEAKKQSSSVMKQLEVQTESDKIEQPIQEIKELQTDSIFEDPLINA